jgi:transposase
LRELTFAHEQEQQAWAKDMIDLLLTMQQAVAAHGGALPAAQATALHSQYRALLQQAESECPPNPVECRAGEVAPNAANRETYSSGC